jgi:hypothetical protein
MKATIGRIVIYESRMANGVLLPATVIRTRDTTVVKSAVDWINGKSMTTDPASGDVYENAPVPAAFEVELPDDDTVDLAVFGLGQTFREYAVPRGEGPQTWHWPLPLHSTDEIPLIGQCQVCGDDHR